MAAPAAETVVVLGGTVVEEVVGLWQVEAGDGVLLAAGLVGATAAEVVEAGVDRL